MNQFSFSVYTFHAADPFVKTIAYHSMRCCLLSLNCSSIEIALNKKYTAPSVENELDIEAHAEYSWSY